MTNYTTLSDSELTEALNFHRRQRNMSRGINEAAHARQTQIVRMLEAEEARRLDEAVKVDKKNYSWGKMITVHHGSSHSFPLHPEHQEKIKNLKDGESTAFKDETGSHVTASREGDKVHLKLRGVNQKTTVAHSHFTEEAVELDETSLNDLVWSKNVTKPGSSKQVIKKYNPGDKVKYAGGTSVVVKHDDKGFVTLSNPNWSKNRVVPHTSIKEEKAGRLEEAKHPIVQEYDDLKKHDIDTLRGMAKQHARVSDVSGLKTKDHAITSILRAKHGNKKVDQAFGLKEEVELEESAVAKPAYHYYVTKNDIGPGKKKLTHSKKKPFATERDAFEHILKSGGRQSGIIHKAHIESGKIVQNRGVDSGQSGYASSVSGDDPLHIRDLKEEVNLNEQIKGWKHAASDLAKWRSAQGKSVKLVSLKKDGAESKMHDATKMFRSEDEAQAHHDSVTELNPHKKIRHNLYVDGKHVKTLGEEVELDEEFGDYSSKKTSEKKSTIAHPDGKPIHHILHKGEVVGTIEPYSAYREKRKPGSRIVSSRTNVTKYSVHFHADKGPTKSADMPLYHKLGHANVQSALKSAADVHSDWLKKSALKEEVDQIDEISKSTLGLYATKALHRGDIAARMSHSDSDEMGKIANKRTTGVKKAVDRLAGKKTAASIKSNIDKAREAARNRGTDRDDEGKAYYAAQKGISKIREEVELEENFKEGDKVSFTTDYGTKQKGVITNPHTRTVKGKRHAEVRVGLGPNTWSRVHVPHHRLEKISEEAAINENIAGKFKDASEWEKAAKSRGLFVKSMTHPSGETTKYQIAKDKEGNNRGHFDHGTKSGHLKEEAAINEAADLRVTKIYNKWPKKATYAVHNANRSYFKEFDSEEAARAHHKEKTAMKEEVFTEAKLERNKNTVGAHRLDRDSGDHKMYSAYTGSLVRRLHTVTDKDDNILGQGTSAASAMAKAKLKKPHRDALMHDDNQIVKVHDTRSTQNVGTQVTTPGNGKWFKDHDEAIAYAKSLPGKIRHADPKTGHVD